MHKVKHNLSESCLKDLFSAINGNYHLRSQSDFRIPGINTVFYLENSITYFGPVIRNSLPTDLIDLTDFDLFKTTIRKLKPVYCSFRLLKNYLTVLGFINVSSLSYQTIFAKFSLLHVL